MTERFYSPVIKYTTSNLTSLPGALLYFYETGTSTPKTTWSDPERDTASAHPVVALADGTFPPIFINGIYRVELKNAAGVTQPGWPVDDVGAPAAGFPFQSWSSTYSYSEDDLVTYGGEFYQSLADANVGNTPSTSPVFWQKKLFLDAPTAESYLNGNADGTYTWQTLAQTKANLSLPTDTVAELALKAPLASPTFTGNPTAPTPSADDNDTSIATTAYVQTELTDRAMSIDNIADLRLARTATNGQKFNVTSYNSGWAASLKPPVGGGIFTYVSTDTTSAEDYGHIIVGADGKRYYRDGVDCVNVQHFGCTGDGSNQTTSINRAISRWNTLLSGGFGAQYPADGALPLYFPAGVYNAPGINIEADSTGGCIKGDGATSQLEGIGINISQYRCDVHGLMLRGAGDYGLRLSDDLGNNAKALQVSMLWIRDKTIGIEADGGLFSWSSLSQIFLEKNDTNIRIRGTAGLRFEQVHAVSPNVDYNLHVDGSGEAVFSNSLFMDAKVYNCYIRGSTALNVVEHYFTECTFTVANQTRTFNITNIADGGGGTILVTFDAPHRLVPKITNFNIESTTNYNGSYDVLDVTSTTQIRLTKAFAGVETSGTGRMLNWDVYIDNEAADPLNRTNDIFFKGGNINYLCINKAYNVQFNGTRLKNQIWLQDGNVNRINIIRSGRGRTSDSFGDTPIGGAKSGWSELVHLDTVGTTASPGFGGIAMRVPNKNIALAANNLPTVNYIRVTENDVELYNGTQTATLGSLGLKVSNHYTDRVTINNGAAYSYTPPTSRGTVRIGPAQHDGKWYGWFAYRAEGGLGQTTVIAGGANVAGGSGILNGSTGLAGNVTVTATTTGLIYIENRTGSNFTFSITHEGVV